VAIDPVCGMEVDTEGAQWTAQHDGRYFYFCSKGCMLDFKEDPEHYLDPDYRPAGMEADSHS
jgi:Cu+-exporting ATPase